MKIKMKDGRHEDRPELLLQFVRIASRCLPFFIFHFAFLHVQTRPLTPMPTPGAILLVDDEDKILKTLGRALRADGHRVAEAACGQRGAQLLAAQDFDLVILDNLMPDVSGLDLIREIVGSSPESERPQIVMMTAHATVERAIEAMKLGALDFLQKPFEIDELLVVASRAVEHQRLRTQHRYLIDELDEAFDHYGIVGRSRAMQAVIERAELVAETREHRAHHRRDRHRQGARRARHPRSQRAAGDAADQGQLRRHPGDAARIRALRPRAGRVHRARSPNKKGRFALAARRHDLPRRDRDARRRRCRPSCCACCRSASSSRSGRSAPSRSTCA